MNGKKAKLLRRLANFKPSDERQYKPLETYDYNGNVVKVESTKVSVGPRSDYQLLKKYVKGEDVIVPAHLRDVVE